MVVIISLTSINKEMKDVEYVFVPEAYPLFIYLLHLFTQGKPKQSTLIFIGALQTFHIVTHMYVQFKQYNPVILLEHDSY